jgi:histone H3/H4
MKVYAVENEQCRTVSLHTTKELAEANIKRLIKKYGDHYLYIYEYWVEEECQS